QKDVSSLRYIALPNLFHEAHMETRNGDVPDGCNINDPESSRISNPTTTLKVPSDYVPMSSKEKGKRVKRQGLNIDQGSSKRMNTSEDVSKEDLKGMMQLVPLEEVYVESLQVKHPIIDWEIHSEEKREY
nr:hypothetical protein [Tanacetum cinerariifolium]